MKLIPNREYEKLKEVQKKNGSNTIDSNLTDKKHCNTINQLNQTKVEDGGKQTIINNCSQKEGEIDPEDLENIPSFPKNSDFNFINDDKTEFQGETATPSRIINQEDKRDSSEREYEENEKSDTPEDNEQENYENNDQNNPEESDSNADNLAENVPPDSQADNLVGNTIPDNLDLETDKIESSSEEGNMSSNAIAPISSADENMTPTSTLDKEKIAQQNPQFEGQGEKKETSSTDKQPSRLSTSLDDKYDLWKAQNDFRTDPELWDAEIKEPNEKELSTKKAAKNVQSELSENTQPYKNPRNPTLKIRQTKKRLVLQNEKKTPYSKLKKTKSGGLKKSNTLVTTHFKTDSKIPVETVSIPSNHPIEKTVNEHTQPQKTTTEGEKSPGKSGDIESEIDMLLKNDVLEKKNKVKKDGKVSKKQTNKIKENKIMAEVESILKQNKSREKAPQKAAEEKKKASRKRTEDDWLPAKQQGRQELKSKLKTRSQKQREKMRQEKLDDKRMMKLGVQYQSDGEIEQIADIKKRPYNNKAKARSTDAAQDSTKNKKEAEEADSNTIIDDLLDPKRPKMTNYTIWNQYRK